MKTMLATAIALLAFAVHSPAFTVEKEKTPLHHIPSTDCGACHQEIYKQWQDSMHAKSSAVKDPIHGAVYKMLVGNPLEEGVKDKLGNYPVCLQCHAPNAARDNKTKLDSLPTYEEGVNCVACHTVSTFHGITGPDGKQQVGTKSYGYTTDQLQSGHGAWNKQNPVHSPGSSTSEPVSNPFPHNRNPALFKSSELCLGCHEQLNNQQGVTICNIGSILTGPDPKPTCQSCHMPVVDGVVSHTLGGGHDMGMLRRGIIMQLTAQSGQETIATVLLENKLLHTLPTGAPFRHLIVKVTALDAAGNVVWKNFTENPTAEDPQSVLMLKLTDDAGKPAMPMVAKKLGIDGRLQPGEKRTLKYTIPVPNVALVRVELLYYLVSKVLVEMTGDQIPNTLQKPVVISRSEVTL